MSQSLVCDGMSTHIIHTLYFWMARIMINPGLRWQQCDGIHQSRDMNVITILFLFLFSSGFFVELKFYAKTKCDILMNESTANCGSWFACFAHSFSLYFSFSLARSCSVCVTLCLIHHDRRDICVIVVVICEMMPREYLTHSIFQPNSIGSKFVQLWWTKMMVPSNSASKPCSSIPSQSSHSADIVYARLFCGRFNQINIFRRDFAFRSNALNSQ